MSPEPDLRPDKRIDEYVLITRLSSYSHVWHAFDEGAQREVVLKFVADRDSASREATILADINHPNILKLLRKFEYEGVHVLVFEYVPGVRLDKAIREGVSQENSYTICMDICSALSEIHRFGLYHGDLSPFNVIWSVDKGKAFLIDFGSTGGCTVLSAAPEHDPDNAMSIGPHTDIVGLGRVIMLLLPKMRGLYEKCLYDEIHLRPTAPYIYNVLKKARDRRKMLLRTTAAIVLLVVVGLASAYFRQPTRDELVTRIIRRPPSPATVQELRVKLFDPHYANFRTMIEESLADHQTRLGKDALILPDLDTYVAAFAFEINPVVIVEQGYFQLGDPIVLGGESGYVSEINSGSVVVRTTTGTREFPYPKPVIFGFVTQTFMPVNIQPGRDNFFQILEILAHINGLHFEADGQIDGRISGSFRARTLDEFEKDLLGNADFNAYNIRVLYSPPPRSIIGSEAFRVIRSTKLSDLLSRYSTYTGYSCQYMGRNDPDDYVYPIMQFHDLTAALGLELEVAGKSIIVREGAPR